MITDDEIRKLSLALSVLGLVGLGLLSTFISPIEAELSDITEELLGKHVTVRGQVKSLRWSAEGHVFLTLGSEDARVKVVVFSSTAKKINALSELEVGSYIIVKGKVSEYKGEVEIVADDIKKLS